jgi:hypothetical protein
LSPITTSTALALAPKSETTFAMKAFSLFSSKVGVVCLLVDMVSPLLIVRVVL